MQPPVHAGTSVKLELYADTALYNLLYPLDEEELEFWRVLARGIDTPVQNDGSGFVLDLGAGPSNLTDLLQAGKSIALDPNRELLSSSPVLLRIQADAAAIPLRSRSATLIVSRLFGVAYAAASDPRIALPALAAQIRHVLKPGGIAALEIPMTPRPRRLQGMEESLEIQPGMMYCFRYLEIEQEHEYGAVLQTEISVKSTATRWELHAPLFVFTPAGAQQWAADAGLHQVRFFACYDLTTETTSPPDDALRAVLYGIRQQE